MPESLLLFKPSAGAPPAGATEILRTPDTFKSAQQSAAGPTALWTPAAGHRFRLMEYQITLTDDATLSVAGETTISLLDGATVIAAYDVWLPAAAITTALGGIVIATRKLPGNGYVSTTLAQALNVSLSTALTGGKFRINVSGAEELS